MIVEFFGHFIDLTGLVFISPMYKKEHYQPNTAIVIGRSLLLELNFGGNSVEILLFRQSNLFNEVTYEQAVEWAEQGNRVREAITGLFKDWLIAKNQLSNLERFASLLEKSYPPFRMPAPPKAATQSETDN